MCAARQCPVPEACTCLRRVSCLRDDRAELCLSLCGQGLRGEPHAQEAIPVWLDRRDLCMRATQRTQ